MDLKQLIAKFIDENGDIALPPGFTLPRLMELLYQAQVQAGGGDKVVLKDWDFSEDVDGTVREFTRTEVNTRIKAVAARLAQIGQPGDRVAVMAPNSAEYLFGFLGAMYAGQVPIPLYDPNEPGHADHLRAVLSDANAKIVVTNTAGAPAVRAYFAELPAAERPRTLAVDSLPDTLAQSYEPVADSVDTAGDTCFLQYTSGSTRNPAGVVITNESIVTDVIQIYDSIVFHMPMRGVSWLPLHHDMGIIVGTLVILLGQELEIFSPREFIQQPKRWIERLARREDDPEDIHVYTAVPNFALDLSARYAAPEDPEEYDLTSVDGIICGSESVAKAGVDSFVEAFSPSGFERTVLRPSYGLAETTLLVATDRTDERPKFVELDREALAEGRAELVDGGVPMASNGQPVNWMHFALVDPETRNEVAEGHVGEIWVHGKNVAAGYLDRPEETAETFHNTIGETIQDGLPKDDWCATGDLGAQLDGHLYITGRVKDLVVVAGRNHYPQDIETTVMEASGHVRKDSVAAFAVPGVEDSDGTERLILLVERTDDATADGDAAAEDAIRAAVTAKHGISPEVIEFYAPGEITRSSAGKIARRVNAKRFLEREAAQQ
ncbi:FadD32-like long-chain-fatty-acid--AMP ligase [Corynebacterium sp. Marseille-P4321]|uniref:FadD32-like long-chain-fatty-acid--AMP ligase n=1 Tax=Corynebacterium sp. Marseille-P4321 TaxID=2736603 RepID=UPI00158D7823|nr:FadD32-like long-chain-fatty-acid--AMP ligase [Corynebacterium sp. Marseille-P4321]